MIRNDGWARWSIWEHSSAVRELYARRCRMEAEEMTCAAQAAELLRERVRPGDTVLDVGCGSGYFFHSLRSRGIEADYWGIDASPSLIEIGRKHLPGYGLPAERLRLLRIEDLEGEADHIVCMNVLTNIDNYQRPLERLLKMARRTLLLRESLKDGAEYHYVEDRHLDPEVSLRVHVNHYDINEVTAFMQDAGFRVTRITDARTGGRPEDVIGHPHYWTFLLAEIEG